MGRKLVMVLASVIMLSCVFGCAGPSKELVGKEKLEAKDWLHAGDLAFKNSDYDGAQYFYELVVKKYPDTYYGRKAKENLGYVKYHQGTPGHIIDKGKEALSPIF